MYEQIILYADNLIHLAWGRFVTTASYVASVDQRIYWLYLLTSTLLAGYVYLRTTQNSGPSARGFAQFLFPRQIWHNPSAWLDVRYFFFHQIVARIYIYGGFLTLVIHLTQTFIPIQTSPGTPLNPGWTGVLFIFVLVVLNDLMSYGIHYLQHKIPVLWEFHKVHHSLEVMHPLSNYREHPVDNLAYAVGTGMVYGSGYALSGWWLGYRPEMPQVLGLGVLMFAFNILGYNLRHSHVWLRWPGAWATVFASPAHHQVHHSCHPDHVDKNFAFMFPAWDVIFNTYCMPQTNRDIRFGLSTNDKVEYSSCLQLYFRPFAQLMTRRRIPFPPQR